MKAYQIIIIGIILSIGSIYIANPDFLNNITIEQRVAGNVPLQLQTLQDSQEAFEYLNEKRIENGLNPMTWDDNVYHLTLYKVTDMYTRGYFDHEDPDNKCVEDYKEQFGINSRGVFEDLSATFQQCQPRKIIDCPTDKEIICHTQSKNPKELCVNDRAIPAHLAHGDYLGYCQGLCKDIPTTDNPKEAVDQWLDSRGHRYWALYPFNTKGAIACYYNYCALIVLNNQQPACHNWEYGVQWWEEAPTQPYEI